AAALGGEVVPWLRWAEVEEGDAGFVSSGVADVPIGFVDALVRHDGARVIPARLRGHFQAPAPGLAALDAALDASALDRLARRPAVSGRVPPVVGVVEAGIFAGAVLHTRDEALAALAKKYRELATLRTQRERLGATRLKRRERRDELRAVARAHPGALRELDA